MIVKPGLFVRFRNPYFKSRRREFMSDEKAKYMPDVLLGNQVRPCPASGIFFPKTEQRTGD
jgi:hypothetical protein